MRLIAEYLLLLFFRKSSIFTVLRIMYVDGEKKLLCSQVTNGRCLLRRRRRKKKSPLLLSYQTNGGGKQFPGDDDYFSV